jgi:hypothetical protein
MTDTPIGNSAAGIKALAVAGDGKIVAAGSANDGTYKDWAMARYEVREVSTTTTTTIGSTTSTTGTASTTTSSTATSTIAKGSSTSTTIPAAEPCATNPRCALDTATGSAACNGVAVPRAVTTDLSRAAALITQHVGSTGNARRRALRKAVRLLKKARAELRQLARSRHSRLTNECTTAILDAIAQQIATVSVS